MMDSHGGQFQAYYESKMLPDRRLTIIRSHVLISPAGDRFLSAHRVISGSTVPTELATGIVSNPLPYLVNYSTGSWYETVPDEENEKVALATEAVGRWLAWAFD